MNMMIRKIRKKQKLKQRNKKRNKSLSLTLNPEALVCVRQLGVDDTY